MGFLSKILLFVIAIFVWRLYDKSRTGGGASSQGSGFGALQDLMLDSLGKMLALISKADGRISKQEVGIASRCLRSIGLTEAEYQKCVAAFNSVHAPSVDAFRRLARNYAIMAKADSRVLLYEMLWMVASADSVLEPAEDELLRIAPSALDIDEEYYMYFKRMYFGASRRSDGPSGRHEDAVKAAYEKLGCSPSDSDEAVKAAYRKLAMRYHPDRLRAEGLSDSMIAIANRSMSEINSAWDLIKNERKYS